MSYGRRIAIVPAGEKWSDGSLRPSFEDFVGAGAVISYLEGSLSAEAQSAVAAYREMLDFVQTFRANLDRIRIFAIAYTLPT